MDSPLAVPLPDDTEEQLVVYDDMEEDIVVYDEDGFVSQEEFHTPEPTPEPSPQKPSKASPVVTRSRSSSRLRQYTKNDTPAEEAKASRGRSRVVKGSNMRDKKHKERRVEKTHASNEASQAVSEVHDTIEQVCQEFETDLQEAQIQFEVGYH